jgi:hypothetical protein
MGMGGMQGGFPGMGRPGQGMQGGFPGGGMGMGGMQGGFPGMGRPGQGMQGGFPGMGGGQQQGGFPGGGMGPPGGGQGMEGGRGGGKFGMGPGGPGGMPGMGGPGGMPGMMGGLGMFTSRRMGGDNSPLAPLYVEAIIEVKHSDLKYSKTTGRYHLKTQWGETYIPYSPEDITVAVRDIATVAERFAGVRKKIKDTDPDRAEKWLELAKWALEHGLTDKVPELVGELAKVDPKSPIVATFNTVEAGINRSITRDDPALEWAQKLDQYKVKHDRHYTILYDNKRSDEDAVGRLKSLEENYKSFYYWFALRGKVLPFPNVRLVAVLIQNREAFEQKHKDVYDQLPLVADGIYARRENLVVLSEMPLDGAYEALHTTTAALWKSGNWEPKDLLKGKGKRNNVAPNELARAQTFTLVMKVLEVEAAEAAVSLEGTRHLIDAIGEFPRAVKVPEWLDFGMASFFGTPKRAGWRGTGAPSYAYLWAIKHLMETRRLEASAPTTLRAVITDSFFRKGHETPKAEDPGAPGAPVAGRDREINKALVSSWALCYFLAHEKLDGVVRYYHELHSMPRDLEIDDTVLLGLFARAFDLEDPARPGQIDSNKLSNFANEWYEYIRQVPLEIDLNMPDSENNRQRGPGGPPGGEGGGDTPPGPTGQ